MTGTVAACAIVLVLSASCGGGPEGPTPLANAHTSSESLARAVLAALAARDQTALLSLAVTEQEFREHVWPELPASRPERNLPHSYVWSDLKQKSDTALRQTLAQHGGRHYALIRVIYGGESTRYESYSVHRETIVVVQGTAGGEQQIRLYGSTLEKAGMFKVFSYVVDD
jgi:hypothetical protein